MAPPRGTRRRALTPGATVAVVLIGAVVIAAVVMASTGMLSADEVETGAGPTPEQTLVTEQQRASRERDPIAVVVEPTALRASPGGREIGRLTTKTEFKSPRVVAVVGRRDGWLRIITSELPNGERAWIDERATEGGVTRFRIRVDLSGRRIDIVKDGRVLRRIRAAVGEHGTPTPTGRFAITDKVPFTDRGSPYGCCALALTAHQPDTPSDWRGGDRIAIHATPARKSIGQSVTLGCMRVPTSDARWLMRQIPLGTQVLIRP